MSKCDANAGEQFAYSERLSQIIVGALVERANFLTLLVVPSVR